MTNSKANYLLCLYSAFLAFISPLWSKGNMVTPVTCDRCRESFGNTHDISTYRAALEVTEQCSRGTEQCSVAFPLRVHMLSNLSVEPQNMRLKPLKSSLRPCNLSEMTLQFVLHIVSLSEIS